MKKWILVAVVLLAAGGYAGFRYLKERANLHPVQAEAGRPTNAVAEIRDVHFAVNAAGEILPAEQVSVRPEVNGRIAQLPVDIGDRVKKDQMLFTLDDEELQIQKSSQLTEIAGAKLSLEQARRNFERSKHLYDEKLISLELFEDTKTSYELASNSLEKAQKSLHLIEDRLSKTKILAPFDCTVLTRPVSVGQAVSGSGGFNSGTEVLTIADLSALIINAHINQSDVTRLRVGQEVEVQIESIANLLVKGKVERIAPQATFKNSIKGYSARIALRNVDERIRPGMTANVRIPIASADQVITVPISAIYTEMGERFVYVQGSDKIERRKVDVGISDYTYAEIRSGLKAGEVVMLEYVPPVDKDSGASPMRTAAAATPAATTSSSPGEKRTASDNSSRRDKPAR